MRLAQAQHCHTCGCQVGETIHTREGVRVQGFALHTGPTEEGVFRRHDDDSVPIVYQRLLRRVLLVTCAECYADPAARARHQSWAYPDD